MSHHSTSDSTGTAPGRDPRDPHRLARIFLKSGGPRCFWREEHWRWEGTHYVAVPDIRPEVTAIVKAQLEKDFKTLPPARRRYFNTSVSRSLISNCLQALEGLTLVPASTDQPSWIGTDPGPVAGYIAVTNGLLDVAAVLAGVQDALKPHSPNWFSPVCLGYSYDPDAGCPGWLAFLDRVLEHDPERIALVQEWFGYVVTPDTSRQVFFIGSGEGANGKTVVAAVQTALLGEANVSHVPLELFGERFALTTSLGKLANIATEIGEIGRVEEGRFKSFVGGDRMYFDRKNLPGVEARPTARAFFTTNTLPSFGDRSSGLWRRMIVMPFRVTIPEAEQDRHLLAALMPELPGIFNWAIAGLRRLRHQGQFTKSTVCEVARDSYRTDVNPARAFLLDALMLAPTGSVPCAVLYTRYRAWCRARGYRELSDAQFGKEVARVFPTVQRSRSTGTAGKPRPWRYTGIATKADGVPVSQAVPIPSATTATDSQ